MTVIRTQQGLVAEGVSMSDLVETWNTFNPNKPVKKFESKDIGIARCSMTILAAENAAGHVGVPKHAQPQAKTPDELAAAVAAKPAAAIPAADPKQEPTAERYPSAAKKTASKTAGKTKKGQKPTAAKKTQPVAKKAAGKTNGKAPAARHAVYTRVKLSQPDVPRRPQEGSKRTEVLNALRKRKEADLDALSDDVGFDCRPYIHKLVGAGWAEIVPSKKGA